MSDKLRVLAYHLYVDWYSMFTNKEKDRERRRLEAERVKFFEMRNKIREDKRKEWIANSEEIDFTKAKEGEDKKEEEKGEEKPEKTEPKRIDATNKDSLNESSLAISNAILANSTQDNVSQMNQQPQNMNNNDGSIAQNTNQNVDFTNNNNMQGGSKPAQNFNNMSNNRLPSLSTLPITNMNSQTMMGQGNNPNMRIPSMFGQNNNMMGQNFAMNPGGMNGMNFMPPGANNVFQGGRFMSPNPNINMMQRMGPYPNINMLQCMPGQMPYGMQRPGAMMYNQGMGMNPGMMTSFPMGNNPYNRMMIGNAQYGMMPPNQQMNPMMRNVGNMGQNVMQRNPNNPDSLANDNQFIPGTLEENAINALTNADYKYTNANDLLPDNYDQSVEQESIDPGPYNLDWLLDEGETEVDFQNSPFFVPEELNLIVSRSVHFEQLYLVKWKNLSYKDATWEPYSLIQQYDELIEAFERRNKKLDAGSRDTISKNKEINKKL